MTATAWQGSGSRRHQHYIHWHRPSPLVTADPAHPASLQLLSAKERAAASAWSQVGWDRPLPVQLNIWLPKLSYFILPLKRNCISHYNSETLGKTTVFKNQDQFRFEADIWHFFFLFFLVGERYEKEINIYLLGKFSGLKIYFFFLIRSYSFILLKSFYMYSNKDLLTPCT